MESHAVIMKIMKFTYSTPESRSHEIHRIQCQHHENHEHLIIPRQKHKNFEIIRIQCKNNEKK